MTARYAIYYTPDANHPLTRRAAAWLGRDAFSGQPLPRPVLPGLEGLDLDALTADPRSYGFHATLKAPFELAQDAEEAQLLAAVAAFAAEQRPFEAHLTPSRLERFYALTLAAPSAQMQALHAACVSDFERYRAALGEADLARRRKARLTAEQDERLLAWGYPHVFDAFRFHMTLTGSVREPDTASRLAAALDAHFADLCGPHRFDTVAVFKQDSRDQPFHVLARATCGTAVAAV
jgi:putative phosphonate metabolism protein